MVPINIVALGTLPPDRIKNASGLFNLTRNLGGAVGLAAINTMLQSRTDLHYDRLAEAVRWGGGVAEERLAAMTAALAPALGDGAQAAALSRIAGMANQQATLMAFSDIFVTLGVLFAGMVLLVPLVQKPKAGPAPAAH